MQLVEFLKRSQDILAPDTIRLLAEPWHMAHVEKGGFLAWQGEADENEYILLNGRGVSHIAAEDGRLVCVGLHVGPCVVSPNIARTRNGISLVSLEVTADALVARMGSGELTDLMLASLPIRNWANGMLQAELAQKAEREWCLAALNGADRLDWFRERYPSFEDLFGHAMIASFLGVTPVTFSRLRGAKRVKE